MNDPNRGLDPAVRSDDEGGLRAPPELHGWRKAWWWFDFIILVKLARLRFIGILLVIGIVITQWDTLTAYYEKWTRPADAAEAGSSDTEYFCPMHPAVIRDNPKDKCPICFMPLSKRKKGSGEAEPLPPGIVTRVQLSPYRMVLAGVQIWPVDYEPLTKKITAVGYIEFNERGQRTVSARVAGRIDKLLANETGQMVKEGDELASLYSPDLLVTVQNLLDAKQSGNREYLENSRTRLELLGIDEAQIEEILKNNKANTHLRIRSPISGHIISKNVREGQYVEEGMSLYDIADLSVVWIQAQIYEDDLAFLPAGYAHGERQPDAPGMSVSAETRAFPGQSFHGKLAFIYPHVDQATRTVTVRFELGNPGHKLRPGSTATVTLDLKPQDVRSLSESTEDPRRDEMLAVGRVLSVPESSVIDTGSERIVYRQASPGTYEGVEVVLGPRMSRADGAVFYPVLKGLQAGDLIVTSGSFLVDAETRLNPAAGSIYFGGSGGSQGGPSSVTAIRPSTPEDPDAQVAASLAKLSSEDRAIVKEQRYCPVLADSRLGSMGAPIKLMIEGRPVFICCKSCRKQALADSQATLAKVEKLKQAPSKPQEDSGRTPTKAAPNADEEAGIEAALAKLSPADRKLAEAQRFCPVLGDSRLGSMGTPEKVLVDGQPVFICCEGCEQDALANPKETLAKIKKLKADSPSRESK